MTSNQITYNVLILDADLKFFEALKYAVDIDNNQSLDSEIKLNYINQMSNLSNVSSSSLWSQVFIETSFVNSATMNYLNKLMISNPMCKVVLLISSQDGLKIKETIHHMDSLEVAGGVEFILSDNVSESMKVMYCLSIIKKGLK